MGRLADYLEQTNTGIEQLLNQTEPDPKLLEETCKTASRAIKRSRNNALANYHVAVLKKLNNQGFQALIYLDKALEKQPENPLFLMEYTSLLVEDLDSPHTAQVFLDKLPRTNASTDFLQGRIYEDTIRLEEAIQSYAKAKVKFENQGIPSFQEKKMHHEAAARSANLEHLKKDPEMLYEMARDYSDSDPWRSFLLMERALKIEEKPEYFTKMAFIQIERGFLEAGWYMDRARDLAPENHLYEYLSGSVFERTDKKSKAFYHYQRARLLLEGLEEKPQNLSLEGVLEAIERIGETAKQEYLKATLEPLEEKFDKIRELQREIDVVTLQTVQVAGNDFQAQHTRGDSLYIRNRMAEAEVHYRRAVGIEENDVGVRLDLIRSIYWQGRPDDAFGECKSARYDFPHEGLFDHFMGQIEEKSNREYYYGPSNFVRAVHYYESAIEKFKQVEKLTPFGEKYLASAQAAIARIKEEHPDYDYNWEEPPPPRMIWM